MSALEPIYQKVDIKDDIELQEIANVETDELLQNSTSEASATSPKDSKKANARKIRKCCKCITFSY